MTIIKLNYIHSNERKWQRPVVESSTTHGSGPLPTFMTTDASGRLMEPRNGLLHPTSSWINITPRDVADGKHAKEERDLLHWAQGYLRGRYFLGHRSGHQGRQEGDHLLPPKAWHLIAHEYYHFWIR